MGNFSQMPSNFSSPDLNSNDSLVFRYFKRLIRTIFSLLSTKTIRSKEEQHPEHPFEKNKGKDHERVQKLQSTAADVLKGLQTVEKRAQLSKDREFADQVHGAVKVLSGRVE